MASTPTITETADPTLTLTPPDPVPVVRAEQAVGLVPVSDDKKSKLDQKVDGFVADLVASDANSPEFGKKVDQLTTMGRKEIMAAAGMSNRFLDRPVRAMDKDSGVGADLAELRRTIEELDPGRQGKMSSGRKFLGIIPFGNSLKKYFDSYQSSQGHIQAILARLASGKDELLMDNAAIDVERTKLWEAMGALEQMIHISRALDGKLEETAADLDSTDPAKAKAIREIGAVLCPPAHPGPADADGGDGAGLSGARSGQEEQRRTGQGRRPRQHHHGRRAAHRGDGGAGDDQPAAGAATDHRAE